MRLPTAPKKKVVNKPKPTKKPKVEKGVPKLNKNYKDNSPYNTTGVDLKLTQMRYGMLSSCNILSVTVPSGTIKIGNNWIALLLLMLSSANEYAISNNQKFLDVLAKNKVTSPHFIVDTVYGKYDGDGLDFVAYKIPDTEYHLEAVFDIENIFSAICGLTKSLGLTLEEISFYVRSIKYDTEMENSHEISKADAELEMVGINRVASMEKKLIRLEKISIMGNNVVVHNIDSALMSIMNWAYDTYGVTKIMALPKLEHTGVCIGENEDGIGSTPIRGSQVYLYCDGNVEGTVEFIKEALKKLGLKQSDLKFGYEKKKKESELKEWELQ